MRPRWTPSRSRRVAAARRRGGAAIPQDEPPAPLVTSAASPLPWLCRSERSPAGAPRAPPREPGAVLVVPAVASEQGRPGRARRPPQPGEPGRAAHPAREARRVRRTVRALLPALRRRPPRALSRAPVLLGVGRSPAAVAAGGWYYVNRMGGRLPFVASASPGRRPRRCRFPRHRRRRSRPRRYLRSTVAAGAHERSLGRRRRAGHGTSGRRLRLRWRPPRRGRPPAAADGHALLRTGNYPDAARAFVSATRAAGKSAAVIQLLVACSAETVQKAVDNGSGFRARSSCP